MTATSDVVAAVAWDESGFELAVLDGSGPDRTGPGGGPQVTRARTVAEVHEQVALLQIRFGDRLACVVESTNGMLDGGLMSAGLRVYRADPSLLPARPRLGSAPASDLARAAVRRPGALTRLALQTGSLTGRLAQVEHDGQAAAAGLAVLARTGRCVQRGPVGGDAPTVAITFDDGPHPPYTGAVLDVLARYEVPATFFCVGLHAGVHRDLVRRTAGEGHQIGNHTWSHPLLADLDRAQAQAQLDRTDESLDAVGERAGRRLFRPPYGAITPEFLDWFAEDPADRTMVLWDVEPFDWARPGRDAIADRVLADLSPGSIVLLHDGGGDRSQTVQALPRILDGLLERNYRIVTVDTLLAAG